MILTIDFKQRYKFEEKISLLYTKLATSSECIIKIDKGHAEVLVLPYVALSLRSSRVIYFLGMVQEV